MDEISKAQAQLKGLFESGLLNEAAYRAALAALRVQEGQTEGQGGERSVEAGEIGGNVATGDHVRQTTAQTYIEKQYTQPPQPDPAQAAQERFLDLLGKRCNILPLAAMGGDEETSEEVGLDQVYIALDTTTRVPLSEEEKAQAQKRPGSIVGRGEEERALGALEAATQERRLVLLGDPGSGKSTFVRQLVARLALARLGRVEPPRGWDQAPLPLLVVLHELAPTLAGLRLEGLTADEERRILVEAVEQRWLAQLHEFRADDFAAGLTDALRTGEVLLVFDGLDEVAIHLRPLVRRAVQAVQQSYPAIAKMIVTCRIRSYGGGGVLPDFTPYTLAAFDEEQIKNFIRGWYRAQAGLQRMDETKARTAAQDLERAALDVHLRELAENPMLLTTMAIIHQREVGLPRERVRLYDQAVRVLLSRWQMRKGFGGSAALQGLLKDDLKLRRILERLAWQAHAQQAQGAEDGALTRGDLLTLLEESAWLGDAGLAAEFLDYIDQRAGLLVGRGGSEPGAGQAARQPPSYSFPHRTFQEYLAGCQMVQGRNRAREYWQRTREGDFWMLAAQLGAEQLFFNRDLDAETLLDLAYDLCPSTAPPQEHGWRAVLWSGHMARVLGQEAIVRDEGKPEGGVAYWQRLVPRLLGVMRESRLGAIERAEAGRILAVLGDPRAEVLEPLRMEFCHVAAGPFVMGRNDTGARDDEQPQYTHTIEYEYKIGRYPVTNAQFGVFVAAGGYGEARYWPEAREAGYWKEGGFKGWIDDDFRSAPYDWGEPFTLANHPVVGVSWYEALAFCRWLSEQMHEAGVLPPEWAIHLPNEPEWEKAARGPATDAESGRLFPWGDEANPNRGHSRESGIGATSAVGCFPGGVSPYGVEEMSGTVWEWTRSLWGSSYDKSEFGYPYDATDGREDLGASNRVLRVLRGGSWASQDAVGCGARDWLYPGRFDGDGGFRIVASPSTSVL